MSVPIFWPITSVLPTIDERPFWVLPDTAQEVTATAVGDWSLGESGSIR